MKLEYLFGCFHPFYFCFFKVNRSYVKTIYRYIVLLTLWFFFWTHLNAIHFATSSFFFFLNTVTKSKDIHQDISRILTTIYIRTDRLSALRHLKQDSMMDPFNSWLVVQVSLISHHVLTSSWEKTGISHICLWRQEYKGNRDPLFAFSTLIKSTIYQLPNP